MGFSAYWFWGFVWSHWVGLDINKKKENEIVYN